METGVDGQTSGGDLGLCIFEYVCAVCDCSDFHVCFVLEPFGVSDGPLSLHVERYLPATHGGGHCPALRAVEEDREYRSLIHTELCFEADGRMAPEWLPERSHDSGRQSNAAIDIGLKVARVGDDGTQVGELVNTFDIIVADM